MSERYDGPNRRAVRATTVAWFTLLVGVLSAIGGFSTSALSSARDYNDRIVRTESRVDFVEKRDEDFRKEMRDRLERIERKLDQQGGVRWRELPPSHYQQ